MPHGNPITKDDSWRETGLCRKCGNKLDVVGILELVGIRKIAVGRCVICGERFERTTREIDKNDPVLLKALREQEEEAKKRPRKKAHHIGATNHRKAVERWRVLDPVWQRYRKKGMTWDQVAEAMSGMNLGYQIFVSTLINRATDLRQQGLYRERGKV
jgi:hypothetical protein